MDQREYAARPADSRPRQRRRRRRKQSASPLLALAIAVLAFMTALALPQEAPDEPSDQSAEAFPIKALADRPEEPETPDRTPDPRGAEPELPGTGGGDTDPWNLLLVNPWNPLPEDYTFTRRELSGGHSVDERCYPDLQAMMDACREEGLSPLICSSYRSQEKQEALFQNKVERLVSQGWSREEAETEAAKSVAVPGTSEHQLGLAVDIVDVNNQNLDATQEDTAVQQWLMAHSWEYGFILRYPSGKSDITGIIYEPWHYRYVGKDAAKEIHESDVCLEEYLGAA